jgi:hypothetical protein
MTIKRKKLFDEMRKLKRFILYLNVIEQSSGKLLGYTGNIHNKGLLLVSKHEIPLIVDIPVLVQIPGEDGVKTEIPLIINGIWNQLNRNPHFYNTGCQLVDPSAEVIDAINEITKEMSK